MNSQHFLYGCFFFCVARRYLEIFFWPKDITVQTIAEGFWKSKQGFMINENLNPAKDWIGALVLAKFKTNFGLGIITDVMRYDDEYQMDVMSLNLTKGHAVFHESWLTNHYWENWQEKIMFLTKEQVKQFGIPVSHF